LLAISFCFSGDIDANPRRSFLLGVSFVMLSNPDIVIVSSWAGDAADDGRAGIACRDDLNVSPVTSRISSGMPSKS